MQTTLRADAKYRSDLLSPQYRKLLAAVKMRETDAMAPRLQSRNPTPADTEIDFPKVAAAQLV